MTVIHPAKIQPSPTLDKLGGDAPLPADIEGTEQKLAALLAETQQIGEASPDGYRWQRVRRDIAKPLRWFMATDALALFTTFICSWLLASAINLTFLGRSIETLGPLAGALHFGQFVIISVGVLFWFEHTGHYRARMPFWLETKKIVAALCFAMMIDGFMQFAAKQDFSRLWLMSGWAFAGFGLVVFRTMYRAALRRQGRWQVPTLLVGNGLTAEETRRALQTEPSLGYEIKAQIETLPEVFDRTGESWETLCAKHGADYVIVALDGPELDKAELPLAQLMREDVPFSVSPPMRHIPTFSAASTYFINHDVVLMTRNGGLEQPLSRFIKRVFDIVIASTALLLSGSLMLLLAITLKLTKGRAFIKHHLTGADGKSFACIKFNLRRQTGISGLPLLLNVLIGDMSLVGPSPMLHINTGTPDNKLPNPYRLRPGLTGLGQNKASSINRAQMENWYRQNWTLWHDIAILCQSIKGSFKSPTPT